MSNFFFASLMVLAILFGGCAQTSTDASGSVTFKGTGIIYFWGTSCRACAMQDKEIKEFLAKSDVPVKKINPSPEMIKKLNLTHYPTIIVFRDGREIQRFKGVTYVDQLLRVTGYYDNPENELKTTTKTTKTTTKPVEGSPR